MNWFNRNSKYPVFYRTYLNSFKHKKKDLETVRFVAFDTETTGLNINEDKILSIGTVGIINFKIHISDTFECYLIQDTFNTETVKIHGLLKTGHITKVEETKAIEDFLNYIGNAILVAHHAAFDIAMINAALKRMNLPKLKNKAIDTGHLYKKITNPKDNKHYSLDELSKIFNITMHDRHTASGDAYITALLFVKIVAKLKEKENLSLNDLFANKRIGLL
ncbi:3'-5' exonuclease [Flaviramulus sp. BrNp1-15]|uniref:3'-5' exonuclease n=1 Tax=Flaviramulus sp. BrNp1-15 TaxID=2916754 RepID=UPI001EE8CE34|nr:3'-5' exonuclease [Flaviramulus sp. BrNp1-15]ULC60787.1 3'-5' exonuclease [Flaviramulus sp. BrNp1-15]